MKHTGNEGTAKHEPWGSPVDNENRVDRRGRRSHTGQVFEGASNYNQLQRILVQAADFAKKDIRR